MTQQDAIAWMDALLARSLRTEPDADTDAFGRAMTLDARFVHGDKVQWVTEAQIALDAIFPRGHAIHRAWDGYIEKTGTGISDSRYRSFRAIVETAARVVREGRLRSLLDGVRAQTVGEVLDQAYELLHANHLTAAAVLAGGGLETHLLHLCQRHGLTWQGAGSISRYEGAFGKARNDGNEILSAQEGKLINAWGGLRNDAAHSPGTFEHSADEVRRMLDGIRDFIVRHP